MEEALLVQVVVRFGAAPIPLHHPLLIPVPVLMVEAAEIPVEEAVAATGNSLILLGHKIKPIPQTKNLF